MIQITSTMQRIFLPSTKGMEVLIRLFIFFAIRRMQIMFIDYFGV